MTTDIPFGRRLVRVSDTEIESYRFDPAGSVAATLGTKDGPVCAPILHFEVLSRDSIALSGSDGVIAVWTRIAARGGVLRIECDGACKTFTIE